ncbi:hypothetical protein [Halocatena halophila]|uniref:hypothetical protein n=1 Tax=Halocatena halophila TaxID=2814576 RepID=UPI002ED2DE3D
MSQFTHSVGLSPTRVSLPGATEGGLWRTDRPVPPADALATLTPGPAIGSIWDIAPDLDAIGACDVMAAF